MTMKVTHVFSIAGLVIAVGLLVAGWPQLAALSVGLAVLVELLASVMTGKRTNEGEGPGK